MDQARHEAPGTGPESPLAARPAGELAAASTHAEDAFARVRELLGTVAPRDPATGKLGPRRDRLELLAELCERETFTTVVAWLTSTTIPSVQSKRNYADDIRLWAAYAKEKGFERFAIGCLGAEDVRTWRLAQERRGTKPRTINRRLSALSSLTRYAAEQAGVVLPAVVRKADRMKIDRHDTSSATPVIEVDELQRVMARCRDARELLIVALIYTLAGRVSESCAADLPQLQRQGRRSRLHLVRKGGKTRGWLLPIQLCELFDIVLGARTDGPLLLDANGERLDRHDVDRLLTRLGREARVLTCPAADTEPRHDFDACDRCRDLTPHVLRASRLTHMHDQKTPLEEIQDYADHNDPATTLAYIRRRNQDRTRERHATAAVDVFAHLLDAMLAPADVVDQAHEQPGKATVTPEVVTESPTPSHEPAVAR